MGGDASADDALSAYDRDKTEKQALVRKTLATHFTAESPHADHADVRAVASALEGGKDPEDVIRITNLTGGYTNYTYKIAVSASGEGEDVNLFAKLCFPRAFWNPDPDTYYDTARIVNEKIMMERFAKLAPGCVAVPYMVIDLEDEMKLLVTQWAPGDEQLSNQMIDGVPDIRVAKNLGAAMASLHCSEIDPDFNTEARECMVDIFPELKESLINLAMSSTVDKPSRVANLARELGPELCGRLMDGATRSYREKEIPVHTDLHAFNCLVEAKPSVLEEDRFGKEGLVIVCDWEMAMKGPLGLDMGRAYSIPVACILAHSVNRHDDVVPGLMKWMEMYWDAYASSMTLKDRASVLAKGYRNGLAWLGWKLYAMSVHEWFLPFMPIEQTEADINALKGSMGMVGLSLMKIGFFIEEDPDLSLEQLQSTLSEIIHAEISNIASRRKSMPRRRRRSSILREQNRRVSDAFLNLSLSTRNSLRQISENMELEGF